MQKEGIALRARRNLSLVTSETKVASVQPRPKCAGEQPNLDIREARTREEKEQLYRFRDQNNAKDSEPVENRDDDSGKRIRDDLDTTAANLFAFHDSRLVGAIRINYAWRCALGVHADFYRMRKTAGPDHPSRSCVISRLVVDQASRGDKLGYRLCAAAYKHALDRDARIAFLSCRDDLIFYFSVLGFKAYMGRTQHEEFGEVLPMKLDLLDERYLMMINSPLLPVLRGWKQSRQPSVEIRPL